MGPLLPFLAHRGVGEADATQLSDDLTGIAEAEYGDHYRGHVLDIYTLYVEMADRVGQRRQSANAFFLSLNSAIVALVGYVQLGEPPGDTSAFFAPVALAGIAISYLWLRIIQSYRQLSSGKYKVVHTASPVR